VIDTLEPALENGTLECRRIVVEPEGVVSILALAVVFAIVFEPPALQKKKKIIQYIYFVRIKNWQ
jgi:hypothetical protein